MKAVNTHTALHRSLSFHWQIRQYARAKVGTKFLAAAKLQTRDQKIGNRKIIYGPVIRSITLAVNFGIAKMAQVGNRQ
eukprot:SAG31_NODE_31833_length_363_cov_1.166667_1_plen_77_part_01